MNAIDTLRQGYSDTHAIAMDNRKCYSDRKSHSAHLEFV